MPASFAGQSFNNTFAPHYSYMNKIILSFLMFVLMGLGFSSCKQTSPEASAEQFLNGLYHYDYEAAKAVSTEETKRMIDLMAQFSAMMPDSVREEAQNIKVDVKDVKVDGERATATYSTSDEPAEKKLNLVKVEDQWLVEYSKMDEELNTADDVDMPAEGPADMPSDVAPADGSAVDTSIQ